MKNYLAPLLIVLVVIVGVVYTMRPVSVSAPTSGLVASSTPVASATSSAAVASARSPLPASTSTAIVANAMIKVNDTAYPVGITPGETGIEAMRALQSSGVLTFTGRDYPGLGFFVDSLGGVANGGGMYWVFYVNGKSATSGISSVVLSPGDVIEWKYEKGY
jgi:hypothetical protein